jgi:hypothetical protein
MMFVCYRRRKYAHGSWTNLHRPFRRRSRKLARPFIVLIATLIYPSLSEQQE